MNLSPIINRLRQIVGEFHVSAGAADRELYSYDASLARGLPDIVVFPGTTDEVPQVVRIAAEEGIPFLPRGFGTNLSGGTVLTTGGIVISLSRLNRILSIQEDNQCAIVQPGVTNLELQQALAPKGFFYAPDPASQKVATLGGNIAENSGGPHCLKYGVTTNHVLGMTAVLSSGDIVSIGGSTLHTPGLDLRGILIGSEGTLAIATEITVRILPKPEIVITMLAIYDRIVDAARSVADITASGITPATLEMMDTLIIGAVEDSYSCGYPRDAAAVLIIEVEGPASGLDDQASRIQDICLRNGCRDIRTAGDEEERNNLWEGRRGAFGAVARISPSFIVNDCTVPRSRLPEALEAVSRISDRHGFRHGNVFHAGDGNLHPLIFFDGRDKKQMDRAKQAGWEIMEACVALGGTITGEHGIGIEKRPAMSLIFTEEDLEVQQAVHHAFDPLNLMNPGKIIPDRAERSDTSPRPSQPPESPVSSRPAPDENESLLILEIEKARRDGIALVPGGNGCHQEIGNRINRPAQVLSSGILQDIRELDPANQVVAAGAGMRLERLQADLSEYNQWLPIRPPMPRGGYTVGSLIALDACGPERGAYGAPRDLLLGLRFIDGNGRLIHAGGKVVKNVAGYDLTRLLAGSMGTLGFITEGAFRISTLPEICRAICGTSTLSDCLTIASALRRSVLQPVYIVAFSSGNANEWQVKIAFEGFAKTVEYQIQQTSDLFSSGKWHQVGTETYMPLDGGISDRYDLLDRHPVLLRMDVPFTLIEPASGKVKRLGPVKDTLIDFGTGKLYAGLDGLEQDGWERFCGWCIASGSAVLAQKAPDRLKESSDVFGLPRPDRPVSQRIKSALDPDNLFSPGRLPGRI